MYFGTKSIVPMKCQGSTQLGQPCRRLAAGASDFCSCHSHQHKFYRPLDPDWPDTHIIRGLVRKFSNKWVMIEYCASITRHYCHRDIFRHRIALFAVVETAIYNAELVYGDPEFAPLMSSILCMLACYPEFVDYLKYFRTKVDRDFRKECQKCFVEKILNQSILDSGSIHHILEHF